MTTIEVSNEDVGVTALLSAARGGDVLLRTEDGGEFILTAVDDFDVEIARTRQNARLMDLLDERALQERSIPLDTVKRDLGLVD